MSVDRCRLGMTLIELLIVVAVLGVLAAIVVPAFKSIRDKSEAVAAGTSMVAIAKAAEHYYTVNGEWPADKNRRVVPPELMAYVPSDEFKSGPIGGVWDYEDWRGQEIKAGDRDIGIAISIVEGDSALHAVIDQEIDDGDLLTGQVRYCSSRSRLVYIMRFD